MYSTKQVPIYLAGKIYKNCWRSTIQTTYEQHIQYIGPRFVACDHGCFHGPSTHGAIDGCIDYVHLTKAIEGDWDIQSIPRHDAEESQKRKQIIAACQDQIDRASVVFAWIERPDAYGTLLELGYAYAKGKQIALCFPITTVADGQGVIPEWVSDWWFAQYSATWVGYAPTAIEGFTKFAINHLSQLTRVYQSPPESKFHMSWVERHPDEPLMPQYSLSLSGRHVFFDFALPNDKIAIEIDGYAFHSSKEKFADDRSRDRASQSQGWNVIRFAASDVLNDASRCVEDVYNILQSSRNRRKPMIINRYINNRPDESSGDYLTVR